MEKNNNQQTQPVPLHQSLYVLIRNRERILFEEECKTITSLNEVGEFDVLPNHENFITIIRDFIRIRKADGAKMEMKIGQGVLKVLANSVTIYTDIIPLVQASPASVVPTAK